MKIKCITVDDEPLALKQMTGYVEKTPFLELVKGCSNAFEAMDVLSEESVDLIFIDINMPDLNGMDFIKSLKVKPYVVFTTAYSEYAVEGFKVDAADYLLKPIDYPALLKAANKVKNLLANSGNNDEAQLKTSADHQFVKSDYKLLKIKFSEIKYIESVREYVKIHCVESKPVLILLSMKALEQQLPSDKFMRVHRSYIVNLDKIQVVKRLRILFDGKEYIPVSNQYKDKFQEYLDGKFSV